MREGALRQGSPCAKSRLIDPHWLAALMFGAATLAGCSAGLPIYTVPAVDINRFMGDWYVIASIPTFLEKGAHNAVESYQLAPDGTIETTFSFNSGGFDGPKKVYRPRGFIVDGTGNAVWGMQFVWPIKAEYRVIFLNEDYSQTVIGRSKRDYVWIMAREPVVPQADYDKILSFLAEQGYDVDMLRLVPHQQRLLHSGS